MNTLKITLDTAICVEARTLNALLPPQELQSPSRYVWAVKMETVLILMLAAL